jgi:hypothetical protein
MLAQLRGLEFSQGGSLIGRDEVTGLWSKIWRMLIPLREETYSLSSTQNRISKPHIIGAFSLRKNELQIDGYSAARVTANTAKEFLQEQYRIMRCMWSMPCQLLSQSVAERQLFAIHSLRPESAQHALGLRVDDDNVFCPIHPDFRAANIIVDEDMHLRGVIDWEFTQLVPRLAFVPPVWISGHDSQSLDTGVSLLPEFLNIVSSKQHLSRSHSQLALEWGCEDRQFPLAHIFRDPDETEFLFYSCIYPKLYRKSPDDFIPAFFQRPENKALRRFIQQRVCVSETYTQDLKDKGLFDDDLLLQQKIQDSMAAAQELLRKARESDARTMDFLKE